MGEKTGLFGRSSRLLQSRDYTRVSRLGERRSNREFVVLSTVAPDSPGRTTVEPRLGMATSRSVGNAVVRNRIRRQVREWFRSKRGGLPESLDLVVIARKRAAQMDHTELRRSLDGLVGHFAQSEAENEKGSRP